jgi:hypothetical protein
MSRMTAIDPANPRKGGSFDVIQSIFTPVHELRFENLAYRGNNRLTNSESYTSTRKRSRKAIPANANR